jgi:hypothetical protein
VEGLSSSDRKRRYLRKKRRYSCQSDRDRKITRRKRDKKNLI